MAESLPLLKPDDVQEYRFTVVKGARPGAVVTYEGGIRSISIGRAVDNDIVVNDSSVSRKHVRVDLSSEGWFVTDLGSSSGTEKMGFRLGQAPEPLSSGDEFKLGDTIFRFEVVAKKGVLKRLRDEEALRAKGGDPGKASALSGLLGNRRVVMLGSAVIVLLLALLLWPETPGLPAQKKALVSPDVNAVVGFTREDRAHLDGASFALPADAPSVSFYFQLRSAKEIEVRAGTKPVTTFEPAKSYQAHVLLGIPRAFADDKGARIVFDNLGWEPADGDLDPAKAPGWALRRAWVARGSGGAASPAQIDEELKAMSDLAGRLANNVGARFALMKGLHSIAFGLMKLAGRPVLMIDIPALESVGEADLTALLQAARGELGRENASEALKGVGRALGQVEGELARESRRLTNKLALAKKAERKSEEVELMAQIVRTFPDRTDPRHRAVLGDVAKLKKRQRMAYDEALARLAEEAKK